MVPSRQTAMKTAAAASFDYLFGQCEQVGRLQSGRAPSLLEVEHNLKPRRMLHRQIGRLLQRIPLS
jgi:hypothetical protein